MSLEGFAEAKYKLRGKLSELDVILLSAYGIAVKNGFKGTEEEWLESLNGYTPQRGIDYWTEEDLARLMAYEQEVAEIAERAATSETNAKGSEEKAARSESNAQEAATAAGNAQAAAEKARDEAQKIAGGDYAMLDDIKEHNESTEAHPDLREAVSKAEETMNTAVDTHNTDTTAHSDIRQAANAAQAAANSKASTITYSVSVPLAWAEDSANGGYYQTVSVSGILASDNPIADIVLGTDIAANAEYLSAWALVTRITTAADSITLYANGEAPATAFTMQLKAVR